MRLPSNLLRRLLVLAFLLPWAAGAPAQERNDHDATAPAIVTTQQLLDLRADLRAGLERLMPMVDAIDTTVAEGWLETSPVERISERLEATAADAPERSIWQAALEHEQAGIERIRGALERAGLALATEQRLGDAERRIREILDARLLAPDDDRSLTRIEQDIASLERRRTQVSLERDQRRQTLERLEGLAHTQQETLERLRRERATDLDTRPWGPLEEPALADAFAAWEHAQERRADARLLAAQLDVQTIDPRMATLRLELQVLETENLWLGQHQRQLASELAERSGEELRSLRAEVRNLMEREPDAAERFGPEIQLLLQRIDRIAETQARVRDFRRTANAMRRSRAT